MRCWPLRARIRDARSREVRATRDARATTTCGVPTSNEKRLGAVLALAHERDLRDFASLLLLEQLGPRTLQSLALIAEVVHGTPTRFDDPARFAFAHGGKDGHPFPVPLKVYDESIAVLRRALDLGEAWDIPTSSMECRDSTRSFAGSNDAASRKPMLKRRSRTSVRSHARSAAAPSSTTRSHARVSWICFDQAVLKA